MWAFFEADALDRRDVERGTAHADLVGLPGKIRDAIIRAREKEAA